MEEVKIPPMSDLSFSTKIVSVLSSLAYSCGNLTKEEIYEKTNKALYEATYGNHYNEFFAKDAVKKLIYRDCNGEEHSGEHWSLDKIKELTSKYEFSEGVTDWDKYVAFNYLYAKFCCNFNYEHIIAIGYLLFFASGEDKNIWDYLKYA